VEHISDRVAVMYPAASSSSSRQETSTAIHTSTLPEALLSRAVPAQVKRRRILRGDVPSPMNPPKGCHFHTRCPIAEPRCRESAPALKQGSDGHFVACHLR
jgi:oligopeptide transport system ATP-binding protein